MFSNRRFRRKNYFEPPSPIYGIQLTPPYGISDNSEPVDAVLNNASIYTLENLQNNPELLKPVNATLLSPTSFDSVDALTTLVDDMRANNEFE